MAGMPGTAIETLLRRERLTLALLAVVTMLAWAYTLSGAGMPVPGNDGMEGMSGDSHAGMLARAAWTPAYALLVFVMWQIMMIAMMTPAAAPMMLLFSAITRRRGAGQAPSVSTGAFLVGYLAVWGVFGMMATGAQWILESTGLLASTAAAGPALGGAILLGAGLYQLTPIKQACLGRCRDPVRFLTEHWRPGPRGALRMGAIHGVYCVGCCWFLMALLFFGGVMNAMWIAGLAAYVFLEKVTPAGHGLSRAVGVLLGLAGIAVLAGAWH
jgi:predicted metal-binding membrane protein